jgi:hypothetical protein
MSTEANAKADRINRQRTAERQEREQEERQRLEQEVLQRYPGFSDIYNKKVADIDNAFRCLTSRPQTMLEHHTDSRRAQSNHVYP